MNLSTEKESWQKPLSWKVRYLEITGVYTLKGGKMRKKLKKNHQMLFSMQGVSEP